MNGGLSSKYTSAITIIIVDLALMIYIYIFTPTILTRKHQNWESHVNLQREMLRQANYYWRISLPCLSSIAKEQKKNLQGKNDFNQLFS